MINGTYRTLKRVSDVIVWCLEVLSTLSMIVIVFAFGWLVFGRYVLNATPTWVEHVAVLLVSLITFTMMAANEQRGANLAVGILTDRLPSRLQTFILAMVDCFVAAFGLACAVYGARLGLFNAAMKIPILGISEGLRMIPLVMGGSVLAFVAFLNAIGRFLDPASVQPQQAETTTLDSSKLELKDT